MAKAPSRSQAGGDPLGVIATIDNLPAPPAVAARILTLAAADETDLDELSGLIQTDQSLTLRLLRLANAAEHHRIKAVETIAQAIMVLGLATVRSIALCIAAREALNLAPKDGDPLVLEVWKHSLACAVGAQLLAEAVEPRLAERAFASGLMHDCGSLVLILADPESYASVAARAEAEGGDALELEEKTFGLDHATAGKRLAEKWGLPELFAEAAWLHHLPPRALVSDAAASKTTRLVALADILAHEVMGGKAASVSAADRSLLAESLGFSGDALERIKAKIGQGYAERAGAFDLTADAAGFYFQALSRANARLGALERAAQASAKALTHSNALLSALAGAAATLSGPAGPIGAEEICEALARTLENGFSGQRALVYMRRDRAALPDAAQNSASQAPGDAFADDGGRRARLTGLCLLQGKTLSLTGRFEPAPGGLVPVFDQAGRLPDDLLQVLAASPARSSFASGEAPIHLHRGFLIVRIGSAGSSGSTGALPEDAAGEMIFAPEGEADSTNGPHNDPQRDRALRLLAELAAQAVSRLALLESCRDRAERLAVALRLMQAVNLKLLHAERLAAVGQLAAGAAHEINNPLAIVYARTQLLELKESEPAKKKVFRQMLEQIERITHILTNLMDFARPASLRVEEVAPAVILEKTLALVRSGLDKLGIEVDLNVEPGLPTIKADARQLEQVFLNLLINAEHAMEASGGRLSLTAAYDPGLCAVVIGVADTGVGIAPENLERIFDPFFTTKEEGKGTGLGLSTAYGIVAKHMGEIAVKSALGQGARITVTLPLDPAGAASGALAGDRRAEKPSGGPSVLVVDDEQHIRDILRESLESRGYSVVCAKNGDEGLALLTQRRFSLMILDVRMPVLGGLELLREAKGIAGFSTPVLVLTGMASPEEIDQAMALGAAACVRKPFQIESLLAAVERLAAPGERP
ncbi:MAG: HDOD domain-containing protein [Desulfovibrionaceae bacterium]|nr:HDOD domain-containing protein [Desulfovibrionaceae bacterium]MBF0515199.1 HDOD domain-containing protein [Desulfovibrionaceae bacterium]